MRQEGAYFAKGERNLEYSSDFSAYARIRGFLKLFVK